MMTWHNWGCPSPIAYKSIEIHRAQPPGNRPSHKNTGNRTQRRCTQISHNVLCNTNTHNHIWVHTHRTLTRKTYTRTITSLAHATTQHRSDARIHHAQQRPQKPSQHGCCTLRIAGAVCNTATRYTTAQLCVLLTRRVHPQTHHNVFARPFTPQKFSGIGSSATGGVVCIMGLRRKPADADRPPPKVAPVAVAAASLLCCCFQQTCVRVYLLKRAHSVALPRRRCGCWFPPSCLERGVMMTKRTL